MSDKPELPEKQYFFDKPRNVKRTLFALFAICGTAFLLDAAIERHVHHPWEGLFGFYAFYGFIACVTLVLVAKEMRKLVMRGEDYYDD